MVLAVFQYARMAREFIGATQFSAVFSLERGKERGRKEQQYFDYYTEMELIKSRINFEVFIQLLFSALTYI